MLRGKCINPNIRYIFVFFVQCLFFAFVLATDLVSDDIQLLGGISGKNGIGVALIKQRSTSEIKAIRLGEDVFGYGRLGYVDRFEMIIYPKNSGPITITSKFGGQKKLGTVAKISTEDRYVEDGFERKGNKIDIDKRYRDKILREELPKVLMEASSEAVVQNGNVVGFRLFEFSQESMFGKLGMKDGDLVREINGVPLTNVARTVQLLNGLRTEPKVKVTIERNGVPVSLEMVVK